MSRPRISAKELKLEDASRTSPSDDGGGTSPGQPGTPPPEERESTNLHTANIHHSSNRSATVPSSSNRFTPLNPASSYNTSYTQPHNEYSGHSVPLQSHSSRSAYPTAQPDGTHSSTRLSGGQRTDSQQTVEGGSLATSSGSFSGWIWSAPHNDYYTVRTDANGKQECIWRKSI